MGETTIGTRTRVTGTLAGDDTMIVRGEVNGAIVASGAVLVERGGRVNAEVQASEVAVAGTIQGPVTGVEKVEILPDARMMGDVRTARILISDGAVFRGRVEMDVGEV